MLYNEAQAVEDIKALPLAIRMHLSHIVRNGLSIVLAAHTVNGNVEKALNEFEARWQELGL